MGPIWLNESECSISKEEKEKNQLIKDFFMV